MAGTLQYAVSTAHVFQRRFTTEALEEALQGCYWYIIGRRPSVLIEPDSVRVDHGAVNLTVRSRVSERGSPLIHTGTLNLSGLGNVEDFRLHLDGSYFSVRAGETVIHGDSWALSSVLTGAQSNFALIEVLYIGQASDVLERLERHKTLQRIYDDHQGRDVDIFVAPLAYENRILQSIDKFGPNEELELFEYWNVFGSDGSEIPKLAIDLIEHALISQFRPAYNKLLREWAPDKPTRAMESFRRVGLRSLSVHLDGWCGLVRFHSESSPTATRSYVIERHFPPPGVAADSDKVDWLYAMFAGVPDALVEIGEESDVALTVFGPQAPDIRAPEEYFAERETDNSATHHRGWTTAEPDPRPLSEQELRQARRRFQNPSWATFSTINGSLSVIDTLSDSFLAWPVARPFLLGATNSLIIGCTNVETDLLHALCVEIGKSRTLKASMFTSSRDLQLSLKQWSGSVTLTESSLQDHLSSCLAAVNSRPRGRMSRDLCVNVLDLCEAELHQAHTRQLLADLMREGPAVGAGTLIRVADVDCMSNDDVLSKMLLATSAISPGSEHNEGRIEEIRASHYQERETSGPDAGSLTFVLQYAESGQSVGQAVKTYDKAVDSKAAIRLADKDTQVQALGKNRWQRLSGKLEAWWAIDPISLNRWHLSRHRDGWVLSQIYSHYSTDPDSRSLGTAITWANACLSQTFAGAEQDPWVPGPDINGTESNRCLYLTQRRAISGTGRAGRWLWDPSSIPLTTLTARSASLRQF